jgi:transposase-like protein
MAKGRFSLLLFVEPVEDSTVLIAVKDELMKVNDQVQEAFANNIATAQHCTNHNVLHIVKHISVTFKIDQT